LYPKDIGLIGSSTVIMGRAAILAQRFDVSNYPGWVHELWQVIYYKGIHPKQVFISSLRRAHFQSIKKKQRYRRRSNGFLFQATPLSSGETRPDKIRAGEHQSIHEPKEMGNVEPQNPGTKGRNNRRTPGGPQGRGYSHGRSGKSSMQTGGTGRRTYQGDQQDLGCYSRGHLQNWVRQVSGDGRCSIGLSSLDRSLQKSMYSINSRLGSYMYVIHQKLEFWIFLCKNECFKLKMKPVQ
jgi:hypothetical protein